MKKIKSLLILTLMMCGQFAGAQTHHATLPLDGGGNTAGGNFAMEQDQATQSSHKPSFKCGVAGSFCEVVVSACSLHSDRDALDQALLSKAKKKCERIGYSSAHIMFSDINDPFADHCQTGSFQCLVSGR